MALLEAELRLGPLGLVDVAQRAARRLALADQALDVMRPPLNLLVLVDQFEELFTYLDAAGTDTDARKALAEEADAFVNLLLKARAVPEARVCVVLTMRTDFLGACVRFLDLPDAINRAQYLTPRLQRSEIALAITGPAHHFGGTIDAALVQELINAVGADADQLPILQHALGRAWCFAAKRAAERSPGGPVQIIEQDFKDAGGVQQALSQHADLVLAGLSGAAVVADVLAPEQVLARELFCAITDQRSADSGGQTVRRPQSLRRIAARAGRAPLDYRPVVAAFAHAEVNFLTYQGDLGPETVIDISHEALIRQWDRLRGWVAAEARRSGEYRRLRRQASGFFGNDLGFSLLTGVALTRAVDWLSGGGVAPDDGWRPSAHWAVRYAGHPTLDQARTELALIGQYVQASEQAVADAEHRAAAEQARRVKDEKDEIERQAARALLAEQTLRIQAEGHRATEAELRSTDATRAAQRQQRQNRMLLAALVFAVGLAAYSYQLNTESNAQRQVIEGQALWLQLNFQSGYLALRDMDALLQLARADAAKLKSFAVQLRDEETLADRFLLRPGDVLSAWVGPSPAARRAALAVLAAPAATGVAEPGSARALAVALLALALDPDPGADQRLASALAANARTYRGNEREAWRLLGSAMLDLGPDLTLARRTAIFQALAAAAQDPAVGPGQALALLVAMATLSGDQPEAAMPALFDQLLAVSREAPGADMRAGAVRAADAADSQAVRQPDDAMYLWPGTSRKAALLAQLQRVAQRLPQTQAKERWQQVWTEIALRRRQQDVAAAAPVTLRAGVPGPADRAEPTAAAASAPSKGQPTPGSDVDSAATRGLVAVELALVLPGLADRLLAEDVDAAFDQAFAALPASALPVKPERPDRRARLARLPGLPAADDGLNAIHQTLARLAARLAPERAASAAARVLSAFAQRGIAPPLRDAHVRLLGGLIRQLDGAGAQALLPALQRVRWSEDFVDGDGPHRFYGQRLWSDLSARLPAADQRQVPAWAREADLDLLDDAPRAPLPPAAAAAGPAAPDWKPAFDKLIRRIEATHGYAKLRPLGVQLKALMQRTPAALQAELGASLLGKLSIDAEFGQVLALGAGLEGLATVMTGPPAALLRQRVGQALAGDTARVPFTTLWSVFAALAASTPAAASLPLARDMAAQIDSGRASDNAVGRILMAAADRLVPADARVLAQELIASIANLPEDTVDNQDAGSTGRRPFAQSGQRLRALEPVLGGLLKRLASEPGNDMAERAIHGILVSQSYEGARTLGRLVPPAVVDTPAGRAQAVGQVLAAVPGTARTQDVDALVNAARELLARQAPSEAVARDLFELTKYPLQMHTADVLRKVFKQAPAREAGWWALVDWARQTWPRLPLDQRAPDKGVLKASTKG